MVQIRNLDEANAALARYIPQVKEMLGKDITLERMEPLMKVLGNPHKKLKIAHIAGTSGKTSTAYYIAALLTATGKKTGLTVSPHLDSVTERVQINLEPLAEADFCEYLGEFMELIRQVQPEPTYFELLMAFAYWYFAKAGVDYAVIETGLGGLYDASNVADNPDKVCVITDIGRDHMHVLGHSLREIAGQKAGIIQAGNQAFMFSQIPEVNTVFEERAQEQNAILNMLSESDERGRAVSHLKTLPEYQQRNWLLAHSVYEYLQKRDTLPALTADQLRVSMDVQVPGRMDIQHIEGKAVIMDGAHNEQKMQALTSSFRALYPDKQAAILLSLKEGKEYEAVLPLLQPLCARLIITTFPSAQDLPTPAIKPEVLAEAAQRLGFDSVILEPDPRKAYEELLKSPEELLLITGSFYLLSNIRPLIIKRDD